MIRGQIFHKTGMSDNNNLMGGMSLIKNGLHLATQAIGSQRQ
jgi:hypothetical protein